MPESDETAGSTVKGVYQLFVGNFLSTVLLALAAIVVVRLLGPAGYGIYTLALVTPTYANLVTQLGIQWAAGRYLAIYKSQGSEERANSFLYSLALFQALLSAAALVVITLLSSVIAGGLLNRPELAYMIPLATLSVVGQNLFTTISTGFQGLGRMNRSALLQVLQSGVKLAASVLLLLAGYKALGAVLGNTLAFLVAGMVGFVMVLRQYRHFLPKMWSSDVRLALVYSAPIFVGGLISGLVLPYQNTLLAHSATNSAIGGFGAAENISALLALFVFPISTTLFPLFSRIGAKRADLQDVYTKTVTYTAIVIVPITMAVMALSSPLTSAIYGRAYSFAGIYLAGIAASYLMAGFGGVAWSVLLNGIGETKKSLVAGAVGSGASLALSTILVFQIGVMGAVVSSLVGQALSVLVALRLCKRDLGINLVMPSFWRIYLASALAAGICYPVVLLPLHPILITLLGGLIFIVALVPIIVEFKAVTRDQVSTLEGYFGRIALFHYPFRLLVVYYGMFYGLGDGRPKLNTE